MWMIIIVLCLTHPELSELPFCTLQSQKNEAYHYIMQKEILLLIRIYLQNP